MTRADVAVIVPVYNRRTLVLDALASVAAQSLHPRRLIVVDDGSTDETADSVRHWIAAAGPPFDTHLLCQENRGVSAARNQGIVAAGACRFLAFLDSDDIWPVDFLERTYQSLSSHPTAVAATCNRRFIRSGDAETTLENLDQLAANASRWLFLNDGGIASVSLFRADNIKRLEGFTENLRTAEDMDLFFRLSLIGPWLHVPGEAVTMRRGLAPRRGEADNLSLHYSDKFRRTASVYDNFIERQGGKEVLPRRLYGPLLSKWWYRAGRELMRAGRTSEARDCFRRSTNRCFWNKAWLRLAQTYVARAA